MVWRRSFGNIVKKLIIKFLSIKTAALYPFIKPHPKMGHHYVQVQLNAEEKMAYH